MIDLTRVCYKTFDWGMYATPGLCSLPHSVLVSGSQSTGDDSHFKMLKNPFNSMMLTI